MEEWKHPGPKKKLLQMNNTIELAGAYSLIGGVEAIQGQRNN